jgi:hypothetical protein
MIDSILLRYYGDGSEFFAGLGIAAFVIVVLIACAIGITVQVLYLLTLQNTLKEVSPENRKMPPANVWLNLIPLFNLGWQFVIVNRMADSLKAEFDKRGIVSEEPRPGYGVGLAYCICSCCGIIPVLGVIASIGGLVCWIIYWVKISGFKTKLQQTKLQ